MGDTTHIFWTDSTFNPWVGCLEVSEECDHCYARTLAERWPNNFGGLPIWGPPHTTGRYITSTSNWHKPLIWNRKAAAADQRWTPTWQPPVRPGTSRRLIFCASLSDVFEFHPQLDLVRARLWNLIESTPMLDWQILTKRPMNIRRMYPQSWLQHPPANVWLGTSVGSPRWAQLRIDALLDVPAAVHFVSAEPLLGPLDLSPWLGQRVGVNWLISGGESGKDHRPFDIAWVRDLDQQCRSAGVAHFFKQVGGEKPESGGCLLDGVEVKNFPVGRLPLAA
jgi:protein gp37